MSAVADKLREARALIARRGGWLQHELMERVIYDNGSSIVRCCSIGALKAVYAPNAAYAALTDAAGIKRDPAVFPLGELAAWNDAPKRKKAEVLAAFDKAIELAERDQ